MIGIDAGKDDGKGELVSRAEIVGEVVIGENDPRGMDRETFSADPNLLFHGASEEFEFRQDFDYGRDQREGMHSHTVGRGFYATPDRGDAVLFSQAFGAGEQPVVVEVLPHEARMFDFRQQDLGGNGNVPIDMLKAYVAYTEKLFEENWRLYNMQEDKKFIATHPLDEPDMERRIRATSIEDMFATKESPHSEERSMRANRLQRYNDALLYSQTLRTKLAQEGGVDLREMLSMTGDSTKSEYASDIFRDFMLGQGYDGVIYIERGDHPEHVTPVSYVFFNLEKVGTYEAWNPKS